MSTQAILVQIQNAAKLAQAALDGYTATHDTRYLERLQFWLKMYRYWSEQLVEKHEEE